MNSDMTRRVTANLPTDLVDEACQASGKGITETLIEGLLMVRRAAAAEDAKKLKGKLKLEIDLAESRERARR
jgi:hypothetical protein